MKRKVLQTLFRGKVELEIWEYKRKMTDQEPEDVFASAYEIDAKITIYEQLLELAEMFSEELLYTLIGFPNLLEYLYYCWLKKEDSYMEELRQCIRENLTGLEKADVQKRNRKEDICYEKGSIYVGTES